MRTSLFEPGRNCWRVEAASRAAFLIDGDAYFKAFVEAARKAQRSILITGWDFHSRTRLLCAEDNDGHELLLGEFLNDLAQNNRDLQIHILIWDYPMIFGMDREWAPIYGLGWKPHRRVHFRYDNTHPTGGSHHQKIVVIDDALAFNGGIDLTARRWDTCAHSAQTAQRVAQGAEYPPFHDLMMLVEGDVACALGDLVRERWRIATGDTPKPIEREHSRWTIRGRQRPMHSVSSLWPESIEPNMSNVEVAIARTSPPVNGHEGVREVEALYADMIRAAEDCVYIENQYFTADIVGDALEARLGEAHGPEIVVVLRKLSHGWLEELTMEALRTRMIARLKAADRYGRLRVVYPFIEGLKEGTCIDVHSKLIIIDDDIVRIGSANIANRSMGMDTECDLAVHSQGREDVSDAIRALRAALLAEHLGVTPEQVHDAINRKGQLRAAIEQLAREDRTLRTLEDLPQTSENLLNVVSVADPERPVALADLMKIFSSDVATEVPTKPHTGPAWGKIAMIAAVLLSLTAVWHFSPASQLFDARRIIGWARELGHHWWAPWVTMAAYTPAALVMFPRSPITLFAVVAFGPWMGFFYAMLGLEFSAWVTYAAGQLMDRDTVRRLAGRKLNDVIQVLRRRGLIAITALRLVPLAPFTIEGIIAGAVGIKLWQFMLGTAIGMLPGTMAATVFGHQLGAALEGPSKVNYWLLGAVIAIMAFATWWIRRWLIKSAAQLRPMPASSKPANANHGSSESRHGIGNVRAI
ncbi:MAG: VTT domain-containing protein [Povalibacter sp.]